MDSFIKSVKNRGRNLTTRIGLNINLIGFLLIILISCNLVNADISQDFSHSIPIKGNSWGINSDGAKESIIGRRGLQKWSDEDIQIRTYFYLTKTGTIELAIRARVDDGNSEIKFKLGDESKKNNLENSEFDTVYIGEFHIRKPGYQNFDMIGINKSGDSFAEVTDVLIGGEAAGGQVYFVKDDFYFGRRGPSVHLNYKEPADENIEYFYNEINVPNGEDVIGSFFMANGFSNGYFGIQVNSSEERRILFSVWSPYRTNNPDEIPREDRIQLLNKGPEVYAGKFGGEGSGGQSYRKYYWKAGNTYRFLLKGVPARNNSTDYTAYFYAPEIDKWQLIASFRRPKTGTYLKRLHSFLENFIPSRGNITRKAYYQNQWVRTTKGQWFELTEARFTADNTARKEARLDFAGGSEGKKFFMKNCGFFSEKVPIGKQFKRKATQKAPDIDFDKLPK